MTRSNFGVLGRAFAATLLGALAIGDAALGQADPAAAEALVRRWYFEGLPYEEARALTRADVARLAEMLTDPAEAEYWANIVAALGMSGDSSAFPALARFAASPPEGEVASAEYRARLALPLALGHLARSDARALALLVDPLRSPPASPSWRYRHLHGTRLATLLRDSAITGLGISARPEAQKLLRELANRAAADPSTPDALRSHLAESLALHRRVSEEGPEKVFGRSARGRVSP